MATSSGLMSPGVMKTSVVSCWFTSEVQQMMYSLGDCKQPLLETAQLIEEITHEQMRTLLFQVSNVSSQRCSRFIGVEDFLFLLRKDKVKLHRFIKFMSFRDTKASLTKSNEEKQEIDLEGFSQSNKKNICYEFISTIDQTGELLAVFNEDFVDELKIARCMRADLLSRELDTEEYLQFNKARQMSFTPRLKTQKFKDWLMQGLSNEIKLNSLSVEIMSYMAYETVAQLVDLALLVRRDMSRTADDPISASMTTNYVNYDAMMGESVTEERHPSGETLQSPPQTPTTSAPSQLPAGFISTMTPAPPLPQTPAFKSKGKKKKDKNSLGSLDITAHCIQPEHIVEVLRRYSNFISPFISLTKQPLLSVKNNLMCL